MPPKTLFKKVFKSPVVSSIPKNIIITPMNLYIERVPPLNFVSAHSSVPKFSTIQFAFHVSMNPANIIIKPIIIFCIKLFNFYINNFNRKKIKKP